MRGMEVHIKPNLCNIMTGIMICIITQDHNVLAGMVVNIKHRSMQFYDWHIDVQKNASA